MYVAKGKHRYKTAEYNQWILVTMRELKRWPPVNLVKFSCDVRIPWRMKTRGDIDNRGKAILDMFVRTKMIPDDRHCLDFRIRYMKETTEDKIEIEFIDIEEPK